MDIQSTFLKFKTNPIKNGHLGHILPKNNTYSTNLNPIRFLGQIARLPVAYFHHTFWSHTILFNVNTGSNLKWYPSFYFIIFLTCPISKSGRWSKDSQPQSWCVLFHLETSDSSLVSGGYLLPCHPDHPNSCQILTKFGRCQVKPNKPYFPVRSRGKWSKSTFI